MNIQLLHIKSQILNNKVLYICKNGYAGQNNLDLSNNFNTQIQCWHELGLKKHIWFAILYLAKEYFEYIVGWMYSASCSKRAKGPNCICLLFPYIALLLVGVILFVDYLNLLPAFCFSFEKMAISVIMYILIARTVRKIFRSYWYLILWNQKTLLHLHTRICPLGLQIVNELFFRNLENIILCFSIVIINVNLIIPVKQTDNVNITLWLICLNLHI